MLNNYIFRQNATHSWLSINQITFVSDSMTTISFAALPQGGLFQCSESEASIAIVRVYIYICVFVYVCVCMPLWWTSGEWFKINQVFFTICRLQKNTFNDVFGNIEAHDLDILFESQRFK